MFLLIYIFDFISNLFQFDDIRQQYLNRLLIVKIEITLC